MGGVLGRGKAAPERSSSSSKREKSAARAQRSDRDDAQLPPLVVLKDCGAQTKLSYVNDEFRKRDAPLLINVVAFWVLVLFILPYFSIIMLVAHTEIVQSLLTFAHYPTFISDPSELQDLTKYGLLAARNIHLIRGEDNVLLRGWHVAPFAGSSSHLEKLAAMAAARNASELDLYYDAELAKGTHPVVIYLHGNTHNRALWYRVGLMQTLSNVMGAHVIAFDYAGFGDSEGWPSEASTYADAAAIYGWVRQAVARGAATLSNRATCSAAPVSHCASAAPPPPKLVLYGHSLGTGVAVHLARELAGAARARGVGALGEGVGAAPAAETATETETRD